MDPLAELAYDFTPYRYGFNNPVFWGDATGLFETYAQDYKFLSSNNLNGKIEYLNEKNSSEGYVVTVIGGQYDGQLFYDFYSELPQNGNDAGGGSNGGNNGVNPNAIPCVSCQHTTTFYNGIKKDPYGVMLYGDETTDFKDPLGPRNIKSTYIQGFIDLSAEFSPDVSKRLENAFELQKYIEKNSLNSKNINTKIKYSLSNFGIYGHWSSDYFEVRSYFERDTFINQVDVSTLNTHRFLDSIQYLPGAKKYNDSINLSIKIDLKNNEEFNNNMYIFTYFM